MRGSRYKEAKAYLERNLMTDEDPLWQSVGASLCFVRFKSGEVCSAHEKPAPYRQLFFLIKK